MYCSNCGRPLASDARVCSNCGQPAGGAFAGSQAVPPSFAQRKLVRPRAGRKIAGVCQGIANMYGWDVTVVRIVLVVLAVCSGIGLVAYVVIWVVAPEEPLALPSGSSYPPPQ